jgi:hypothetical protein
MGGFVLLDNAIEDLFSMHRDRSRRLDADTNLMARNGHNRDRYVITDSKPFVHPPSQDQHVGNLKQIE